MTFHVSLWELSVHTTNVGPVERGKVIIPPGVAWYIKGEVKAKI